MSYSKTAFIWLFSHLVSLDQTTKINLHISKFIFDIKLVYN